MPAAKKSASAVAKSPAVVDEPPKVVGYVMEGKDACAVSFVENVLTVDLTALGALPQGERQAALKVARGVLDRANQ